MNKTLTLTKVLFKNSFNSLTLGKRKGKGRKVPKSALFVILMIFAFIPFMTSIAGFVANLYDGLAPIDQEGVILGIGLSMVSLIIFIFGIVYIINVFYFSQDIEQLLPLPFKAGEILSAKFIITLFYEYLTALLFLLPIMVTFGVKSGAGPLYYLLSLLIFILLPIIPLVIGGIIAMVVMGFTNVFKNKDRFRMIGGILSVVLVLGINFYFQRYVGRNIDPNDIEALFSEGNQSFIDLVTGIFITTKFATHALLQPTTLYGLANLALFVGLSGLSYFVFVYLGKLLFFKGVMGISETTARRERLSSSQLQQRTGQSSALKALTLKELRILFRTPVYFMNCVLMSIIWPFIMIIIFFAQSDFSMPGPEVRELIFDPVIMPMIIAGVLGVTLFISGGNAITSTAVSREGTNFFVNKFLPVPYKRIFMAKINSGILLSSIGLLIVLAFAIILFRPEPLLIVMIFMTSFLGIVYSSFAGLIIDLFHPKLVWDNEQKAVKQNMNSVYQMIVSLITAGIFIFVVIFFSLSLWVTFFGLFVSFTLLNVLLYYVLINQGERWVENLDV